MPTLPITPDVAALTGSYGEHIQNRSLLLDKFSFHKRWGLDAKEAEKAHLWSFMRVSDRGSDALSEESARSLNFSRGRNVQEEKRVRLEEEAKLAKALASTNVESGDAQIIRVNHSRRFLSLFRAAYGERTFITVAQLEGRLAINLADSLIPNAGISLDRLFGAPFIPGSAIKGVCRHAALEELHQAEGGAKERLFRLFRQVFGTADTDFKDGALTDCRELIGADDQNWKGCISFLPAYPLNVAKVVVDLTTVHYPDYYRSGDASDLMKEKPLPNSYPTVEVGAQFGFCLLLLNPTAPSEVMEAAAQWLKTALTVRGLGAKTAAGYGWFSLQEDLMEKLMAEEKAAAERAATELQKKRHAAEQAAAEISWLASLPPEQLIAETLLKLPEDGFALFAKSLSEKSESEQRAFLDLLRGHKEKRERWKAWKKKKPDLAKAIEAVRIQLNAPSLP